METTKLLGAAQTIIDACEELQEENDFQTRREIRFLESALLEEIQPRLAAMIKRVSELTGSAIQLEDALLALELDIEVDETEDNEIDCLNFEAKQGARP